MEITQIAPFLHYYDKVRGRTIRVIERIPADELDRSPIPGKFTFADLIRHIAAIERFMFAETVRGNPSRYRGCGKDLADGYDEVRSFFDRCHDESMAIFAELTPEDLQRKCTTPAGATITAWKWLRSLSEHEIHHRGQLYTYLSILGLSAPPMYGLTAEQVASVAANDSE